MDRVLLLGYFGAGNFGDDALLVDWLLAHHAWLEQANLTVDITGGGQDFLALFEGVDHLRPLLGGHVPKKTLLYASPGAYRMLVAPGGSLLQDATSVRSIVYYLWVIRRFGRAGIPVAMLHQGVGPLNSWVAAFFTPRVLVGTALLTFRDAQSYAWAQGQRALSHHPGLSLSADPLLAARLPRGSGEPGGLDGQLPGDYALIIPKRTQDLPTPRDETTEPEALAALLRHVVSVTGLTPVLLPLHLGQDSDFCQEVSRIAEDVAICDPQQLPSHRGSAILDVIAGARLVISYRLHGLVTAASYGVPFLGVAYDPKISAFCDELGLPYCFPATVHERATLSDVERLWTSRDRALEDLGRRRQSMLNRLKLAEDRFRELCIKAL